MIRLLSINRYHLNRTSQSSTFSTSFSSCCVSGNWGHVLDSSDFDLVTGNSSQSRLGSWSWGLVSCSTSSSKFDMHCCDFEFLKSVDNINCGHHGSIGWGFISIGFDFHSSSDSNQGLSSSQVSDMDKGVVPCCEDMADGEEIAWNILWAQTNNNFLFGFTFFGGGFLFPLGDSRGSFWFCYFSH